MAVVVELYDPRDPIDAAKAVFEDILEGRKVVADRETMIHVLFEATELLREEWSSVANAMACAAHSLYDSVDMERVAAARERVVKATEIAETIMAATLPAEAVA